MNLNIFCKSLNQYQTTTTSSWKSSEELRDEIFLEDASQIIFQAQHQLFVQCIAHTNICKKAILLVITQIRIAAGKVVINAISQQRQSTWQTTVECRRHGYG